MTEKYLLCCDWGTSSFRLRLIDQHDDRLVAEVLSTEGVARMFDSWKTKNQLGDLPRASVYEDYLKQQIDILAAKASLVLDGVSIVISGMASSSLGMEEIAYANLPFNMYGEDAKTSYFEPTAFFLHDILLISGVRSAHDDVLRGEETQLVGLAEVVDKVNDTEVIFILPGTHSKHMMVRDGLLVDFRTFMTGEVYQIMASHSILKDSIDRENRVVLSEQQCEAFRAGVKKGDDGNLLNSLFTVRTNQLFGKMSRLENGMYLSGLLIGAELSYLVKKTDCHLVLCSGGNLSPLYVMALETLGLSSRTTHISDSVVDRATVAGQKKIFNSQFVKRTT